MNTIHEWYALAILYDDAEKSFEYIHGINSEDGYGTKEEADKDRDYLQPNYEEKIVILKETRQVME